MREDEYLEGMEERREEREEARGVAVGTGSNGSIVAEEYGDSGDESNGPSSDNMG
jgi:hypothetical protein